MQYVAFNLKLFCGVVVLHFWYYMTFVHFTINDKIANQLQHEELLRKQAFMGYTTSNNIPNNHDNNSNGAGSGGIRDNKGQLVQVDHSNHIKNSNTISNPQISNQQNNQQILHQPNNNNQQQQQAPHKNQLNPPNILSRIEKQQPNLSKAFSSYTSSTTTTITTTTTKQPIRKWAVAFLIGGCNSITTPHRGFLYNVMVTAKTLEHAQSKTQVIVLIQMSVQTTETTLTEQEIKQLQALNVQIYYLPKTANHMDDSFYGLMLEKFRILELEEYSRVLFLDGDVMLKCNLDYLFELSEPHPSSGKKPTLRENILLSYRSQPANGGFFILKPNRTDYLTIQSIIHERELQVLKMTTEPYFDVVQGWGHVITPPDKWRSPMEDVKKSASGTEWKFHGNYADQGLLYHWGKYVKQDISIIIDYQVENWKRGSADNMDGNGMSGTPILEETLTGVFDDFSCMGARHNVEINPPPYRDFQHFSGFPKPWQWHCTDNIPNRKAIDEWHEVIQMVEVEHEDLDINFDFVDCDGWRKQGIGRYPTGKQVIYHVLGKQANHWSQYDGPKDLIKMNYNDGGGVSVGGVSHVSNDKNSISSDHTNKEQCPTLTQMAVDMSNHFSPPNSQSWNKNKHILTTYSQFHTKDIRGIFSTITDSIIEMLISYGLTRYVPPEGQDPAILNSDEVQDVILIEYSQFGHAGRNHIEQCIGEHCDSTIPRIIIQAEQLKHLKWAEEYLMKCHMSPHCIIWDFSDANYEHAKTIGTNGVHDSMMIVPTMYHQRMEQFRPTESISLKDRTVDIAFFGKKSARRTSFQEEFESRIQKRQEQHPTQQETIEFIFDKKNREEDVSNVYAKAKICLNVHALHADSAGEIHRLSDFSTFGCRVVSETIADNFGMEVLSRCGNIRFADYDELGDALMDELDSIRLSSAEELLSRQRKVENWWRNGIEWKNYMQMVIGPRDVV